MAKFILYTLILVSLEVNFIATSTINPVNFIRAATINSPFSFCSLKISPDELNCCLANINNKFSIDHFRQWVESHSEYVKNITLSLKCTDNRAIVEMPLALGIPTIKSIDIEGCIVDKLFSTQNDVKVEQDQREEFKLRHCRLLATNLSNTCQNVVQNSFMTHLKNLQLANVSIMTLGGDTIQDYSMNKCIISVIMGKRKFKYLESIDLSLNSWLTEADFDTIEKHININLVKFLNFSNTGIDGKDSSINVINYTNLRLLNLSGSQLELLPAFANTNRMTKLLIDVSRTKLKSTHNLMVHIFRMRDNPQVSFNMEHNSFRCTCEDSGYVKNLQYYRQRYSHLDYLDSVICKTPSGSDYLMKIDSYKDTCQVQTSSASLSVVLCITVVTTALLVLFVIRSANRCLEAAHKKAVMEAIGLFGNCTADGDTSNARFDVFISFHINDVSHVQ